MLRPQVKAVHRPFLLPDRRIIFGRLQYGVAAELMDDDAGSIEALLKLLDGTRDTADVSAAFVDQFPDVSPDSVHEVIENLAASGFLEEGAPGLPDGLSTREADRYAASRHYFAWIDPEPRSSPYEIQSRLKASNVALLGLGGTGTAVAAGLVASGVNLHCADFDSIEESNLTRQLLYTESDVGRDKVDRAVARLRALNSLVTVTGEGLRAQGPADLADLMAGRDAFVLCADTPQDEIVRWVNVAALRTGTPWFVAFYNGPMTVVGGFRPGVTGCWACLEGREREREETSGGRPILPEVRLNPVIAAGANVSGHLCALEVIYHLAGLPGQAVGRILHFNLARWDHQYFIDVPPDPECPVCGSGQLDLECG